MSNKLQRIREHVGDQKDVWVLEHNNGLLVGRVRARVIETLRAGARVLCEGATREMIVQYDRIETDEPLPEPKQQKAGRAPVVEMKRQPKEMARVIPIASHSAGGLVSEPEQESDVDSEYRAWLAMGEEIINGYRTKQSAIVAHRAELVKKRDKLLVELEEFKQAIEAELNELAVEDSMLEKKLQQSDAAIERIELQKRR